MYRGANSVAVIVDCVNMRPGIVWNENLSRRLQRPQTRPETTSLKQSVSTSFNIKSAQRLLDQRRGRGNAQSPPPGPCTERPKVSSTDGDGRVITSDWPEPEQSHSGGPLEIPAETRSQILQLPNKNQTPLGGTEGPLSLSSHCQWSHSPAVKRSLR